MDEQVISKIQVPRDHYFGGYDHSERWSSYWVQISEALNCPVDGPLLEVGVGNGLVAHYLQTIAGKEVVTLDIDPALEPEVVGDILNLPFGDQHFACSMACEVLEHLPWEQVLVALAELRRVSTRSIVSVPNNEFAIQVKMDLGRRRHWHMRVELPKLFRRSDVRVPNEHYWELGAGGIAKPHFKQALKDAGWQIEREYRNPDNVFHQFFVLV